MDDKEAAAGNENDDNEPAGKWKAAAADKAMVADGRPSAAASSAA